MKRTSKRQMLTLGPTEINMDSSMQDGQVHYAAESTITRNRRKIFKMNKFDRSTELCLLVVECSHNPPLYCT